MPARSAGLLLYRGADTPDSPREVLLVHPGGPLWARRDAGAWSIPKGEYGPGEDSRAAALREFNEETGHVLAGPLLSLGEAVQPNRKIVTVYAAAGDLDPRTVRSNSFEMEWPPRSGRRRSFPEVDRAGWFTLSGAREKILPGQAIFLDRLAEALSGS